MTNEKKVKTNEELTQELNDLGFEHRMLKIDFEFNESILKMIAGIAVLLVVVYLAYSIGYAESSRIVPIC